MTGTREPLLDPTGESDRAVDTSLTPRLRSLRAHAFTPGNQFFSGNAPVLMTGDSAIHEIYYRSVLTLLVLPVVYSTLSSRRALSDTRP